MLYQWYPSACMADVYIVWSMMTVMVVLVQVRSFFSTGGQTRRLLLRELFALLFPVLPNEYFPSWWVFFYSGNQLDTLVHTHRAHMYTHTVWAPCMRQMLPILEMFWKQLVCTFHSDEMWKSFVYFKKSRGNVVSYQYLTMLDCVHSRKQFWVYLSWCSNTVNTSPFCCGKT